VTGKKNVRQDRIIGYIDEKNKGGRIVLLSRLFLGTSLDSGLGDLSGLSVGFLDRLDDTD